MDDFDKTLYEIIKQSGFVKPEQLDDAYQSSRELQKPLFDILIFRGLCSEQVIGQLIANNLKTPFVSLANTTVADEILEHVPEHLARRYRVVPFAATEKELSLAMQNPNDMEAIETIRRRSGLKIKPYYVTKSDMVRAMNQYKRNFKQKFQNIILQNVKKASTLKSPTIEELLKVAQDIPVVKIFDALLEYAVAENASDIHLESASDSVLVRLRIDGILNDIITLPSSLQPAVVARIKVLSNLKIDEHRAPQDGRFRFQIDESLIALRVSIIPAYFGENVVLRILQESSRPLSLEELGIIGNNLKIMHENIKKPFGMILVTGPTGAGKTTTLYSVLNIVNTPRVKICTVEDPVEYGVARVNQIQVNPKTNLTFAAGLRSLLRHDPDIIMVGEIRDEETVSIAIHAALTGHLVLSTLHTNDAIGAIARLIDMGSKGYLLSSTLNVVVAQRLVRRICTNCITEMKPPEDILRQIEKTGAKKQSEMKFFYGKGCNICRKSGFHGRVGIYEILEVSEEIRDLIAREAPAAEIDKQARKNGFRSMYEDGLEKVQSGQTTIEELLAAVTE